MEDLRHGLQIGDGKRMKAEAQEQRMAPEFFGFSHAWWYLRRTPHYRWQLSRRKHVPKLVWQLGR